MSDSDGEDNNEGDEQTSSKPKSSKKGTSAVQPSAKLPKSKVISKISSGSSKSKPIGSGASRKDMHGATVVPVAAHLKYKKLLEKK